MDTQFLLLHWAPLPRRAMHFGIKHSPKMQNLTIQQQLLDCQSSLGENSPACFSGKSPALGIGHRMAMGFQALPRLYRGRTRNFQSNPDGFGGSKISSGPCSRGRVNRQPNYIPKAPNQPLTAHLISHVSCRKRFNCAYGA